jgi:hypothetical protein
MYDSSSGGRFQFFRRAPIIARCPRPDRSIWTGGECAACKLRELCPGPLSELEARKSKG